MVYEATTANYDEQLKAAEFVVVDYYGDHCRACVYLAPFFQEAEAVLVCRKLYVQDMAPACVAAGQEKILPYYGEKGGWHRVYTGEIVEAYQKTIDN